MPLPSSSTIEHHAAVLAEAADPDLRAGGRVADRVRHQVLDDALDLRGVDGHRDGLHLHLDVVARGFSVPSTLRRTRSARSVGRRCGETMPRCSRSRSSRSDSSRSSFRAFAAIRSTRSSASSCGSSSSGLLQREAEPRIEVSGVRRSCEHRLQERVLHVVERAEALRGLPLTPERLGVLALAPAQSLLGALALGDVDHEPAQLPRSLGAAHDVHHVADPDRACRRGR